MIEMVMADERRTMAQHEAWQQERARAREAGRLIGARARDGGGQGWKLGLGQG